MGDGATGLPAFTRCTPSATTTSPSFRPLVTEATAGVDWPSFTSVRRSALLSAPDDVDVIALLIHQDRRAWDREHLDRRRRLRA